MLNKEKLYKHTEGAGGGKGGGGGTSEGPDTLVTDEVIKILHLLSEGEVNLFTGDGKSIYLNNVPLENPDGTYNFGGYNQSTASTNIYTGAGSTFWEYRNGSPSQTPMTNPAFPSSSEVFTVNAEMFGGTTSPSVAPSPVIYSVSNADVGYCKVAINFPNGLENVDGNGNLTGDSVEIAIDVAPHTTDAWVNVIETTISYQASQSSTIQYQVNTPSAGALWDIRARRITQDNSSATRKNQTYLLEVEEVQQITLPYNGIAYCGLALDAATIGGSGASIPTMSFLVAKGPIAIPSNYTPATIAVTGTATYSGEWNGTFTTGATDNPAWILWDMLTNTQYGCGLYGITPAMIDSYSFYNASVFNDTQVPDGNGGSGTERQFTFNAPIQNRQDMLMSLQQVAGMMNAALGMQNGLITLFQDRPTNSSYLVTKASVLRSDDSKPVYFTYSSTAKPDRNTAVNVTWTNASDLQYLPTTSSVVDTAGLTRYGYNPTDLAAFGATSEGQALRAGRYMLYEGLYNTQQVEFKAGMEGYLYNLFDVFDLFDDDYATTAVSGRVVSATSATVTLDQAVTITGTGSKISVWLQDGVTYESHTIANSAGTYSTLTISGTWSTTPTKHCIYGVTSGVHPRQFRINNLAYDGVTKEVTVTAKLYSNTNYDYVTTGILIPSNVYSTVSQSAPATPTNLIATPSQYIDVTTKTVQYAITISWQPVAQSGGYVVKWQKDNGAWTSIPQSVSTSFTLTPTINGSYSFLVYNVNIAGNSSAPAAVSYTQSNSGGGTSTVLSEITNLYVTNTTGDTWTGLDLPVQWTNPSANQGLLKDFVVTFSTTGGTVLRAVIVDGVAGGATQHYTYTYAMNEADNSGTPLRSIVVKVQGQDSSNNLTTGISATMTNPAPAVPLNITANVGPSMVIITWTPETSIDVAGYIVWMSTMSGFTPSSANATDCGLTAIASYTGLTPGETIYYEVAAYDVFGKSLSGTGLNVSSQLSAVIPTNVGIASGSTLPGSSTTNGFFFDTANQTLYQWNTSTSAWVQVGITYGTTLPSSGTTNQQFYDTANQTLYRWNGTSWVPAINGASIQANSVAANTIVTGSLTSAQVATGGLLASNIDTGSLSAAVGSFGSILANLIGATTVTATTLNISSLSAITGNVGTLTAGTISNNSGTNTINLSATGTTPFINSPNFSILANGNATFAGTLSGAIVNAGNMNVSTLSAISANMGTVTAGIVQNSTGSVSLNLSTGLLVVNNGTTMSITGNGFGASNQFIEWHGPTQSSASNYAACTTSNATSYVTTTGVEYFAGQVNFQYGSNGYGAYVKFPPDASGRVYIQQYGISTGSGASLTTGGGNDPNTVTYPIAFPTKCIGFTASPIFNSGGLPATVLNGLPGLSSCSVFSGGFVCSWQAFGY
jgi:predicted phage tail protein